MLFSIFHPQPQHKGSDFSAPLSANVTFSLFMRAVLMGAGSPHCGFDLNFPNSYHTENIFLCLLAICTVSLEKHLLKSFAHFFNRLVWFYDCL